MGDTTEPSLRDALSGAFDQAETEPQPTEPATPEVPAAPAVEAKAEAPAPESASESERRSRDEKGRFAPSKAAPLKPGADSTTGPPAAAAAPAPPPTVAAAQPASSQPAAEAHKAPQSLRPAAREKWASVPQEVQADFVRRERETQLALQESAAARRVSDAFREIVRPYEGIMRAQGAEPLAAVAGVLQSHAALTIGPMEQRAEQLVKLWRYSGVPPEMLDQALARNLQPGQGGQPSSSPAIDPNTLAQQIEQRLERKFLAQHQQATQHQAESDIEAFAQTSPEFLTDVQDTMADLLELAARRRKVLTHQQAYEIAIRDEFHHPDIAQILKQRDAQKAAENAQASTQRARAAASSVRSQPAVPSNGAQPSSLREHLEQAFSEASGR